MLIQEPVKGPFLPETDLFDPDAAIQRMQPMCQNLPAPTTSNLSPFRMEWNEIAQHHPEWVQDIASLSVHQGHVILVPYFDPEECKGRLLRLHLRQVVQAGAAGIALMLRSHEVDRKVILPDTPNRLLAEPRLSKGLPRIIVPPFALASPVNLPIGVMVGKSLIYSTKFQVT